MTEWIRTEGLLDRLPVSRHSVAPLVKTEFMGKKEVPPEIPLRRAIAVGAFAQAHARGVSKPRRIYDLVANASAIEGMLVVVAKGSGPRLVPASGFEPTSAVVIDLDLLTEVVRTDGPVLA